MRESCTPGSVRGVLSNGHSYRDRPAQWILTKETPFRKAGIGVSSAEPKASQPTFLDGNPVFRNAFLPRPQSPPPPKGGPPMKKARTPAVTLHEIRRMWRITRVCCT